jgi:hypothetical protein
VSANSPLPSETTSREKEVPSFTTVTRAPGTTAMLVSRTTPYTVAVVTWASRTAGANTSRAVTVAKSRGRSVRTQTFLPGMWQNLLGSCIRRVLPLRPLLGAAAQFARAPPPQRRENDLRSGESDRSPSPAADARQRIVGVPALDRQTPAASIAPRRGCGGGGLSHSRHLQTQRTKSGVAESRAVSKRSRRIRTRTYNRRGAAGRVAMVGQTISHYRIVVSSAAKRDGHRHAAEDRQYLERSISAQSSCLTM